MIFGYVSYWWWSISFCNQQAIHFRVFLLDGSVLDMRSLHMIYDIWYLIIWYMIWDDIFSIYWHIDIWYLIWYLLWYLKYTVALFNHICIIWYDITILYIKSFHIIRTIYRSKLVGQRDVEPTGNTWQTHEYICCERWKCVPLPNCIRHWKARSPFFKLHVWIPKSSKQGRGRAKKMQPFFRLDLIF